MEDMDDKKARWLEERQYQNRYIMSPEIVEIDESMSFASSNRDGGANNVYVAVGKDDLDVLKWALNHAVVPGACVFLIHVFPPVNYIPTPVGKMPRSRASQEQVNTFLREENTRRRNLLQKYVRLCNDKKVTVETILIESNQIAKAILELLPVLNITMLVMGTKRHPSRRLRTSLGKGEMVHKSAPNFCEVAIVLDGKKVIERQHVVLGKSQKQSERIDGVTRCAERSFFNCACFSGNSR